MTNFEKMLLGLKEKVSIDRAVEALCKDGVKPCTFCEKPCCGDCKAGVRKWLLKEADNNMLPEICSCGYRFVSDETICLNCGKKVEENG